MALIGYLSQSGGFPIQARIYDTPFPQEGAFNTNTGVPFTSGGVITEGHLYLASGGGCGWNHSLPAANGEEAGSNVFLDDDNILFEDAATLIALAEKNGVLATPVSIANDGKFTYADLYSACGFDWEVESGAFIFIGKITNLSTGLVYNGSGQINTCY